MNPSVSILVCTYGRTAFLAECLESFARQEYDGVLELVVLNDCPLQTLHSITPGVRIVNASAPFPSYAAKRNAALALASHGLVCLWDDDDIYLPTFVATVVGKMQDGDKAARLSRLMKWDGRFAHIISGAQYHTAVFVANDIRAIGGWKEAPITDADFARRLVTYRFFHGVRLNADDGFPPLVVYRADPDRIHMEGGGAARLTREQYMDAMNRRIYDRKEPAGDVDVIAGWSKDWVDFVAKHLPAEEA